MTTAKRIRTTLRRAAIVLAMVQGTGMAVLSLQGEYDRATLCGVIVLIAMKVVDENEEPTTPEPRTTIVNVAGQLPDDAILGAFVRGMRKAGRDPL